MLDSSLVICNSVYRNGRKMCEEANFGRSEKRKLKLRPFLRAIDNNDPDLFRYHMLRVEVITLPAVRFSMMISFFIIIIFSSYTGNPFFRPYSRWIVPGIRLLLKSTASALLLLPPTIPLFKWSAASSILFLPCATFQRPSTPVSLRTKSPEGRKSSCDRSLTMRENKLSPSNSSRPALRALKRLWRRSTPQVSRPKHHAQANDEAIIRAITIEDRILGIALIEIKKYWYKLWKVLLILDVYSRNAGGIDGER